MSTDYSSITVSDLTVHVVRKPIKNLHLAVYPPDGLIRIAVPEHLDDDAVRLAIVDRIGWINRQREELRSQPRQSKREMVTGESHYAWGKRYRLRVVEDDKVTSGIEVESGGTLTLTVPAGADRDDREQVLTEWYRRELKEAIPTVVEHWQGELGINVEEWRVRKMRTKWGTCNAEAGRIWLNLELARMAPSCLEYVVVHEMLHLQEPGHTDRFEEMLNDAMPTWRQRRDELKRLPLSHEEWPELDIAPPVAR